ncbi:MAG TPA: hypothetical protein VKU85_12140 [bacterium]|nr:hypothetical protein [bacterium]
MLGLGAAIAEATPAVPADAPPVSHENGVPAHAGVDALYEGMHQGYASLDADGVGRLYTETAHYLSPQKDIKRGRTAIGEGFAGMFARAGERGEHLDIRFRIVKRQARDDLVADVGYYTLRRSSGDGSGEDTGKFVTVAERDASGAWRFSVDGYSAIRPWQPGGSSGASGD